MSTYKDIINNNLKIDLDCLYDEKNNKIDVYSSVYWTAENKEDYENCEKIINEYKKENELFELFTWCDISGFDYWVIKEQEKNYVSFDVILKKPVEQYTHEDIEKIKSAIVIADDYFQHELL